MNGGGNADILQEVEEIKKSIKRPGRMQKVQEVVEEENDPSWESLIRSMFTEYDQVKERQRERLIELHAMM